MSPPNKLQMNETLNIKTSKQKQEQKQKTNPQK